MGYSTIGARCSARRVVIGINDDRQLHNALQASRRIEYEYVPAKGRRAERGRREYKSAPRRNLPCFYGFCKFAKAVFHRTEGWAEKCRSAAEPARTQAANAPLPQVVVMQNPRCFSTGANLHPWPSRLTVRARSRVARMHADGGTTRKTAQVITVMADAADSTPGVPPGPFERHRPSQPAAKTK